VGGADSLTIAASVAKLIDGRWDHPWCQAELILDNQQVRALAAGGEAERTLTDNDGTCQITVSIKAS
jgi:hypothetical protein